MEELGGEGREEGGGEGVGAPFNVLPQGATDVVAPLRKFDENSRTTLKVAELLKFTVKKTTGLLFVHMVHYTVKPLLFACPLFHDFHKVNKNAKLKGTYNKFNNTVLAKENCKNNFGFQFE